MRFLALNCSPRGAESNTRTILGWVAEGAAEAGVAVDIADLVPRGGARGERWWAPAVEAFLAAELCLVALPLYTDSTPGAGKEFFERLAGRGEELRGKKAAFIVHSGFPEALHSRNTLAWLERAAARLGMEVVGAAIKGGSEGLRMMPPNMTGKARADLRAIGAGLAREGSISAESARRLSGSPRRMNPLALGLFALVPSALKNFYWNMMLKKHKAFDKRFDRPYAAAAAAIREGR